LLFAPFNCTIVARSATATACCGSAKMAVAAATVAERCDYEFVMQLIVNYTVY